MARPDGLKRAIAALFYVAVGLLACHLFLVAQERAPEILHRDLTGALAYEVVRIVDGDTVALMLDGKDTTVRLIDVDTPETVHPQKPVEALGKEARRFTQGLSKGESVPVEYGSGPSKLDRYRRTSAYLYRAPHSLFVDLKILRHGYWHTYTKNPFQHTELFCSYQRKAREAMKYHREGCRYFSRSKIPVWLEDAKQRGYAPCSVCRHLANPNTDRSKGVMRAGMHAIVVGCGPTRGVAA